MKKPYSLGSPEHNELIKKYGEYSEALKADPFYVLGRLEQVINGASIPGVSR